MNNSQTIIKRTVKLLNPLGGNEVDNVNRKNSFRMVQSRGESWTTRRNVSFFFFFFLLSFVVQANGSKTFYILREYARLTCIFNGLFII